jgi:RNA polymerase sigma-70 factor (ECF subfamily)
VDPASREHPPPPRLDQIETDWAVVCEPAHVVARYADAIHDYLRALLRAPEDAEEVAQEFFLRLAECGLPHPRQERGRFRDYLKKAVRNAALNYLRGKQRAERRRAGLASLSELEAPQPILDQEWVLHWRDCLLRRAWQGLKAHQQQAPDGLFYTVLRLAAGHPLKDSRALAMRAARLSGRALSPEAFRKQLSRARRKFAALLLAEVRQTLDTPSREQIEEELIHLGLMPYVRDFLPTARPDEPPPPRGQ